MKPNLNLLKQISLIIAGLVLITSCSTYEKAACPDLSNNRSYSKKYMSNNKTKRNLHKNRAVKDKYYAFRKYNSPNYKTRNAKDYTINHDKSYILESSQVNHIPAMTEFQIPAGKDEKFDLIASSGNSAPRGSSVLSVPEIKNSNKGYAPVASEDISNLTKKDQREIIKPYKKDLRNAARAYPQVITGQQPKSALGFSIASIVLGLVGLFVFGYICGALAIIFGLIALKRTRDFPGTPGRGLAIAGIVLGLVDVILLAILMLSGTI